MQWLSNKNATNGNYICKNIIMNVFANKSSDMMDAAEVLQDSSCFTSIPHCAYYACHQSQDYPLGVGQRYFRRLGQGKKR